MLFVEAKNVFLRSIFCHPYVVCGGPKEIDRLGNGFGALSQPASGTVQIQLSTTVRVMIPEFNGAKHRPSLCLLLLPSKNTIKLSTFSSITAALRNNSCCNK